MDEYWNLFLEWLGANKGKKILPTAPKAKDRYKNSYRVYPDNPYFQHRIKYLGGEGRGVIQDTPYSIMPATIERLVSGNDTTYFETPERKRFTLRGPGVTRTASNRDVDLEDYYRMQDRFNTAWGLARDIR